MGDDIPFNRPVIAGHELRYVSEAVTRGNIAGDGHFTRECQALMQDRFSIPKVLLTPSCTAALEMAMLLFDVGPDDEVILPSFTFVSTANAIVQRGAHPRFVDIDPVTLCAAPNAIAKALTERTKAIIPVHYAGVSADMDAIRSVAEPLEVPIVEDAAQGVHAYYRGRALGSIGNLGTYSFHATKNYTCGEGGALCINDPRYIERAEIIREKGTDRSKFFRGEVDKYTWVDIGSSYVPSELASAFLYAQLEQLDPIADRRRAIYELYDAEFEIYEQRGILRRPVIPGHCRSNYHMYYILLQDLTTRDSLIEHMRNHGIGAVFHYLPLHDSPMGHKLGYSRDELPITVDVAERLLRLPFFYDITEAQQHRVVATLGAFFDRTPA